MTEPTKTSKDSTRAKRTRRVASGRGGRKITIEDVVGRIPAPRPQWTCGQCKDRGEHVVDLSDERTGSTYPVLTPCSRCLKGQKKRDQRRHPSNEVDPQTSLLPMGQGEGEE